MLAAWTYPHPFGASGVAPCFHSSLSYSIVTLDRDEPAKRLPGICVHPIGRFAEYVRESLYDAYCTRDGVRGATGASAATSTRDSRMGCLA